MLPSVSSGRAASSRLGHGSRSRVDGREPRFAPATISSIVAPTGTSAHGPGNSCTPSISQPQARIADRPTIPAAVRSHIGQVTSGSNAPTRTPSSSSQPRAKLL